MKSSVYYMDLRTKPNNNLMKKLEKLLNATDISSCIQPRDLTAIKIHFGEYGNTAYIRSNYVRKIVQIVKTLKAIPFLTDANTLYAGTRSDAPTHIQTAVWNGFSFAVMEAPLIIADGLRGKSESEVEINQKNFKSVYIGKEIVEADALVSVAHFKGHELSGFGGTIKNLGMGCASRKGKLAQHSSICPRIIKKKCKTCGQCLNHCSQSAISIDGKSAKIDAQKCIGCGECILICPEEAVQVAWNQNVPVFLEAMVEHTAGVLKGKEKKSLYINFITDVAPACDCYPHNDAVIVGDIGIVASKDPVAIDQASVDLVNQAEGNPHSCLNSGLEPGGDKFKAIYPNIDWPMQLEYAEKIGLGSRKYDLIKVD
ncbi:4Fe-4S ferredoxin [Candidatus Magnetomorum sp. HK-1]|nr:4Fe-4S ferredoxin [Candidatus Magnetomorum sp. HK-1]